MNHVRFGDCVVDLDSHRLFRDDQLVHITPKAFELIRILIEHAPKALSKAELTTKLWPGTFVSDDALARLVSQARVAVGDSSGEPRVIRTVHRFGYAFDAPLPTTSTNSRRASCKLTWASHEFPLNEGDNIIGRDPDAAVPITAPIVSRRHARVIVDQDVARLEDLHSKNGTFVGEQRLMAPRLLRDGDIIRVGDYELVFHTTPADMPTVTRQP